MHNEVKIQPIAYIQNDFHTKFAIPRQGGLVDSIKGTIIFEKEYRDINALRGLENYSHIWLLWHFSEANSEKWKPTVRPPRLGGNKRVGVFATRSPFRPNPLGLTCVKLESIEYDTKHGPIIHVCGGDLMNNTPIFDIKPYLPHIDRIDNAKGGFALEVHNQKLEVEIPEDICNELSGQSVMQLIALLEQDPRPHYHNDPERVYGFCLANHEIKFTVYDNTLKVVSIHSV